MEQTEKLTTGTTRFKEGVQACLPTVLGYLGIGFAAGVVEKGVGLSVLEILLLSLMVYAGSGQFIIAGLLAINAPTTSIVLTVFLVDLRHFLMSLSIVSEFKEGSLLKNIFIGSLLTDESYGVLTTTLQEGHKVSHAWMNGLNVTAYATWVSANVAGGLLGNFIPDPSKFGLDFALTGMFLGLCLFQLELPLKKQTKRTLLVAGSVILTLILMMRFSTAEVAVIGATLVGCFVGMVMTNDN